MNDHDFMAEDIFEAAPRERNAAEDLARVSELADVLAIRMNRVAAIEAELREALAELRKIEEEDFPVLLQELGLEELKLKDGRKIKLEKVLSCGISEANQAKAFEWLRERNFAGIIKSALTLEFDRSQDAEMIEAMGKITEAVGRSPTAKQAIHNQTLKSFIKERREAAGDEGEKNQNWPPEDLFGIFIKDKVSVKMPR